MLDFRGKIVGDQEGSRGYRSIEKEGVCGNNTRNERIQLTIFDLLMWQG